MNARIVNHEVWNKIFNILLDHSVSEVEVNAPDGVFIKQKGKRIHLEDIVFESEKEYLESIEDSVVPLVDSMGDFDPNGYIFEGRLMYEAQAIQVQARCHIMLPPVCDTPQITMAKRSKTLTTLEHLAEMGSMSTEMLHFLQMSAKANLTVVFSGQSGAGKDLAASTKIPTPQGFKEMGELNVGDYVFNERGKQVKIVNKYAPKKDQKYLVEFSNGEKIAAGEGHVWRVIDLQDDYVKTTSFEVRVPLSLNNVSKLEVAQLTKDSYMTTEEFLALIEYTPVDKANNLTTDGNIDPIVDIVSKFEVDMGQFFALTVRSVLDINKPLFAQSKSSVVKKIEKDLRAWDREEISFNELFEVCGRDEKIFASLTSVSDQLGKKIVNKREVADFLLKDHYRRVEAKKTMNANTDHSLVSKNLTTKEMFEFMYGKDEKTGLSHIFTTLENRISSGLKIDPPTENIVNFAVEKELFPAEFDYDYSDFPIHPYVLGLWLGNPNGSDGRSLTSGVKQEILEIKAKLVTDNMVDSRSISVVDKKNLDENGNIISTLKIRNFRKMLKEVFSSVGDVEVKNTFPKIIPDLYMFTSSSAREDLIAGMVDSGGFVDENGNCNFIGLSEDVVKQLRVVVSSLGIRTSPIRIEKRTIVKDGQENKLPDGFKLSFLFDRTPFGLNRNIVAMQDRLNDIDTVGYNDNEDVIYITKITEQDFGEEEFFCIEVDSPSHLFLAGETFIPTHNTTMLEAMTKLIPNHYRIGVAEDTPELNLVQENVTYLHSVPWAPKMSENDVATLQWVVSQFQRNRCDKLIIGETRGKEFGDFLIAANSGMEGSMTTIHANDPKQCLTKMTNFAMKAADKQPIRAINLDIAEAIDIIVQLVVIDGKHRISHISAVIPVLGVTEEAKITLTTIYEWDRLDDSFFKKSQLEDHVRDLLDRRGVDYSEFIQSPLNNRVKHHNYAEKKKREEEEKSAFTTLNTIGVEKEEKNSMFGRKAKVRKGGLPPRRTI